MKIGWINGWAVPSAWFARQASAAFPDAVHVIVAPGPCAVETLAESGRFDVIVGYSLGSHLLLTDADHVNALTDHVVLLAPVFAFAKEEALGGRVSRTQVRFLERWLRTDRAAALDDFYGRAGLTECKASPTDADSTNLVWGLERLANGRCEPFLPANWCAYAGEQDALLDAGLLCARVPRVVLVKNATHHPAALINAWAADFIHL
ncbi:MAG: hypothetical protein WC205_19985 [Opitutaceae bacterium]|jgi:hypothetical protein